MNWIRRLNPLWWIRLWRMRRAAARWLDVAMEELRAEPKYCVNIGKPSGVGVIGSSPTVPPPFKTQCPYCKTNEPGWNRRGPKVVCVNCRNYAEAIV